MSLLSAKQIKFTKENQLIVGTTNGNGRLLDAGQNESFLKFIGNQLTWGTVDVITDSTRTNSIRTTSSGITFETQDTVTGTLLLLPTEDGMVFRVDGTKGAANLLLEPAEDGHVVIGGLGDSIIEVEPNENLTIRGGEGLGNLFLGAGANGKVYYGDDDSNPLNEIATIGTIRGDLSSSTQRIQYDGSQTLTVPAYAVLSTLTVYINGVMAEPTTYSVASNTVTLTELAGFTLDAIDIVTLTFIGIA